MLLLPVLDLKDGLVVRGVGGRRDEYRPIVSRLTASSRPVDIALAFRDHFGLTQLYLADLDAIAGKDPALALYAQLRSLGFRLWVDAGIREVADAHPLAEVGVDRIVAGLETLSGPETLARLCQEFGSDRIVFSLDLKEGRPLGNLNTWDGPDARTIAARAISLGIRRLIVLDLAHVGGHSGTGTDDLCADLVRTFPQLELVAGGGIRDTEDLKRLERCGVKAALVASALHDGRIL
jgi:phosphoribosylformimino-5-aminoimidazole carboxamide ribotide isomerase